MLFWNKSSLLAWRLYCSFHVFAFLTSDKSEGMPMKRRRVSFGGHLRPELFDENLPPNTPLKRGETPTKRKSLGTHSPAVLKTIIKVSWTVSIVFVPRISQMVHSIQNQAEVKGNWDLISSLSLVSCPVTTIYMGSQAVLEGEAGCWALFLWRRPWHTTGPYDPGTHWHHLKESEDSSICDHKDCFVLGKYRGIEVGREVLGNHLSSAHGALATVLLLFLAGCKAQFPKRALHSFILLVPKRLRGTPNIFFPCFTSQKWVALSRPTPGLVSAELKLECLLPLSSVPVSIRNRLHWCICPFPLLKWVGQLTPFLSLKDRATGASEFKSYTVCCKGFKLGIPEMLTSLVRFFINDSALSGTAPVSRETRVSWDNATEDKWSKTQIRQDFQWKQILMWDRHSQESRQEER